MKNCKKEKKIFKGTKFEIKIVAGIECLKFTLMSILVQDID